MRRLFLEDLPANKNGTIKWKESVGYKVRFEYDDVSGEIEIIGYDNKKYYVKVRFGNRVRDIHVGQFKKCMIGDLIGKRHSEYMYNVDDIIHDKYLVKEQIKIPHAKTRAENAKSRSGMNKAYVLQHIDCGYIFSAGEDNLNTFNQIEFCPVCCDNPNTIVKGYNDVWTTNPEVAKLLWNKEEGYKYSKSSRKKVDWKCTDCGSKIKNKSFNNVSRHGLSCSKCRDGVSFPEKVMRELLKYCNIHFDMHVTFQWSNGKEYDFYLPEHNMIIETNGNQHYDGSFEKMGGRSLEEEEENDRFKMESAYENNVESYVVIDCRESEFEYIYNNIAESILSRIIDFNAVDKHVVCKNSMSNYLLEACNIWNSGVHDVKLITSMFSLSEYTIRSYLRRGSRIGICDYSKIQTSNN